jgi:hypothetical protein
MRFSSLVYNNSKIVNQNSILDILEKEKFHWLIDSEVENAEIEINKETLIWYDGSYYSGNWHYGIFKGGDFYGRFENGIIEGGNFKGKFISGIRLDENKK